MGQLILIEKAEPYREVHFIDTYSNFYIFSNDVGEILYTHQISLHDPASVYISSW